jgi:hypothetical protein
MRSPIASSFRRRMRSDEQLEDSEAGRADPDRGAVARGDPH